MCLGFESCECDPTPHPPLLILRLHRRSNKRTESLCLVPARQAFVCHTDVHTSSKHFIFHPHARTSTPACRLKVWDYTPEYYRAPFHCYPEGNLCWQAALEVEPSALSVHANIYTPKGEFEAEGDDRLRSNFHQRMREMLRVRDGRGALGGGAERGGVLICCLP